MDLWKIKLLQGSWAIKTVSHMYFNEECTLESIFKRGREETEHKFYCLSMLIKAYIMPNPLLDFSVIWASTFNFWLHFYFGFQSLATKQSVYYTIWVYPLFGLLLQGHGWDQELKMNQAPYSSSVVNVKEVCPLLWWIVYMWVWQVLQEQYRG